MGYSVLVMYLSASLMDEFGISKERVKEEVHRSKTGLIILEM